MTRQMIFLEDKEGSHNGISLTSHKQGDIVSEDKLSEYLKTAWEDAGSIEEYDPEADYDFEEDEEEDISEEDNEEEGEDNEELTPEAVICERCGAEGVDEDFVPYEEGVYLCPDCDKLHQEEQEGGEDGNEDNNSEGEEKQEGESNTEGEEGSSEDEGNESGEGEDPSEEGSGEEEKGEDQETGEKDDVQILKDKAIALIAEEEKDIDAIKKIGLDLGIEHLDKCSKPETILSKVKAYLEA